MKDIKIFWLLIFIVSVTTCFAIYPPQPKGSIHVIYNNSSRTESIQTHTFDGNVFVNVQELNKAFHAAIQEDHLDNRVIVSMYNSQFIFLMESPYLFYPPEYYSMVYPMIYINERHYIPATFLTVLFPAILKNKIRYDEQKTELIVDLPIDNSIRRILIDPGHGGKDPGAVSFSRKNQEKKIVLQVALKLKKLLLKKMDVEVLLTRSDDCFIPLNKRTDFANKKQGDLFISLHCNSSRRKAANGIEVFVLATAKTDQARAVEALENSVVYEYEGGEEALQKYDDLSLILSDMAQTEQLEESIDLAIKLQANMVQETKATNRGVKQANFYVLRVSYMPAVLVELGFLSNKSEEKKLTNSAYQDKLVTAIYEAVKSFKQKHDMLQ
ncbi:MAG: N-acetylmuramoyl-L-alanine amidase [Candidatus Cloacimonetes bacterium]|nr:N-acetylmuramoyl-L-alanine amidase [Candidatus Cloacimonadota bacterium]